MSRTPGRPGGVADFPQPLFLGRRKTMNERLLNKYFGAAGTAAPPRATPHDVTEAPPGRFAADDIAVLTDPRRMPIRIP